MRYDDEIARKWFLICVVVSVLLHFAVMLIPLAQRMTMTPEAAGSTQGPLTVHLQNPAPRPPPAKAEPAKPVTPPITAPVIATRRRSTSKPTFTVPPQPDKPQPQVQPTPQVDQPDPLQARLNARRAQRDAEESEAAQENAAAAAASGGPSRDAIINANLKHAQASNKDGTGGVFQITSIGVREGSFKFNGWNPARDNWHESYTVDAGEGGNVKLAIVRKVIEVIRKYKTGDFEFESHRLGRMVPQSARPADNDRLEAFLMQELFSDDSAPPARSRS